MMDRLTIDEVIEHCNKTCDMTEIIANARGHELESIESNQFWEHYQVRAWLKELKFIRQWKSDVMYEFCKYNCNSVEEARHNGYNKAIDDFVKALCIEYAPASDEMQNEYDNVCLRFEKIAEQLKAGGENDNLRR